MDTGPMLSFLSEAHYDGRLENQWSESVSVRIARCVLGLLRDVGFLREVKRGRREIVDYRMSDEGTAILARELKEKGVTDSSLCAHSDWALFGLDRSDVISELRRLSLKGVFLIQTAGDVIRIGWRCKDPKELSNAMAEG